MSRETFESAADAKILEMNILSLVSLFFLKINLFSKKSWYQTSKKKKKKITTLKKKTKLFIQVNIAEESQKSGVLLNNLDQFYNFCIKELSLNITGLMCLPPINSDSNKYFNILKCDSR